MRIVLAEATLKLSEDIFGVVYWSMKPQKSRLNLFGNTMKRKFEYVENSIFIITTSHNINRILLSDNIIFIFDDCFCDDLQTLYLEVLRNVLFGKIIHSKQFTLVKSFLVAHMFA